MTSVKNNNARTKERRKASKERHETAVRNQTDPKSRRRLANEALHREKVAAGGLGKRELRRIASGVRKQKTAQ